MSSLFSPYRIGSPQGGLELANRIVIAPMCQYSGQDGLTQDWHLMHWANLLNGGAGLFTIEATAVAPEGRITHGCLGLWNDAQAAAFDDTLQRARRLAPPVPVCLQLSHAGRKASSAVPWKGGAQMALDQGGWQALAPSAVAHKQGEHPPKALDLADLARIRDGFASAAARASQMGIEAIELHGAHGYLLHQFLSPISNQRTDAYGGSFEGRIKFPLEVFAAVRSAYQGVLGIRLSATDWVEGGWNPEETADLCQRLKLAGADYVHISSGGVSTAQKITLGPGYQVPFAKLIRQRCGLPTIAVGLITEPDHAQAVIDQGEADLVALARSFLYKPRWAWEAAAALKGSVQATPAYWRCMPREAGHIFGDVKTGQR
mgnify:CR=1 FL=1